jgi:hypothetical protein
MAFGTPVVGATAYSAAAGTSVAPAYPSGVLATDQLVMFVGMKPSTANGGTLTAPTGWTIRDSLTAAGGYGTTLGADTGNTNLWVLTKDTVTAGLTGSVTVTIGGNNVSWAFIVRVPTSGGTISYGTADGQRTTTPTSPMSIALTNGASATNFTAGDIALWAMCIPTDVTTPSQFSAQSITATGATFNTAVELNEPDSTTGNDIGGYSAYATVASGSSTTAPTVTSTLGGTLTNVRGPVVLLRLHETLSARTGDLAATETGADAFSSSGDVHVKGSLAVSETGSDTFSASGAVLDPTITGTLSVTETGADSFSSAGDVFVKGSLNVTETGTDTFSSTGDVFVKGTLSVTETGSDTFASTGHSSFNTVTGSFAASEASDVIAVNGVVIIKGNLTAAEAGVDTFEAVQGTLPNTGSFSASESGSDVPGGYVNGYVNGYVGGISGYLGRIGGMAATESGGAVTFGINAVMKYYDGTAWQILYKDPTVYT